MTDTPQILLAHHLKALKLPTFLREYDKVARLCAAEGVDHPPFAVDQFQFGQAQQKANMIEALGGALPSELVVLAQERRQLERLQVMSEQKLGRIGHDAALVSRPRYILADVIAT